MDITDINKVASRKRISADVEKLRNKVSRENKKIIKFKGAQDTACWSLKENLREVETNHAKLQQNMLEVQMKNETVSGQYQEELRHRPEILNKDAAQAKITELTTAIETKNQEIDSKASIISHLMTEVKTAADASAKLEITLQSTKSDIELERRSNVKKEQIFIQQIERLEVVVRTKDDDLSKHMNINKELRCDKKRLQDKIKNMQNKIDNIQKELNMRQQAIQFEVDDNAVMLTPSNKKCNPAQMQEPQFPAPRTDLDNDSLENFLSDSSEDGDNTIDVAEVNRRFEALSRGERLSPVKLASLMKRRAAVPVPHGGLQRHSLANKDKVTEVNRRLEAMCRGERLSPVPLASLKERHAAVQIPHGGMHSKHHSQTEKDEDLVSLSQIKEPMKDKPRKFFKRTRIERNAKKN